jgi:sec-independent protein translocase protein TatB
MFDIGFLEICFIAIIALLVFGPEKLPSAARSAGLWVGRIRRMITSVKQEMERELRLQEAQEALKESEKNSLHQFVEETKTNLNDLKKPITFNDDKSDQTTTTTNSPSNTNQTSQITQFR